MSMVIPKQSHRLKELSRERGLRVANLAVACDVSVSAIDNWMAGRNVIPSDQVPKLALALGVSVIELMNWPDEVAA